MLVSRRTFFFGSFALPAFAAKKKPELLRPAFCWCWWMSFLRSWSARTGTSRIQRLLDDPGPVGRVYRGLKDKQSAAPGLADPRPGQGAAGRSPRGGAENRRADRLASGASAARNGDHQVSRAQASADESPRPPPRYERRRVGCPLRRTGRFARVAANALRAHGRRPGCRRTRRVGRLEVQVWPTFTIGPCSNWRATVPPRRPISSSRGKRDAIRARASAARRAKSGMRAISPP